MTVTTYQTEDRYNFYVKDYMRERMQNHVLIPAPSGKYEGYWLRHPSEWVYSLLIMELPTGIVLSGDLCIGPGRGGVAIAYGYQLDWFSAHVLSQGYLCSKFLQEVWQEDVAERHIEKQAKDKRSDPETRGPWHHLLNVIKNEGMPESERDLYELMDGIIDYPWEYSIGRDYPLGPAGWLCAAQERFCELMNARRQAAERDYAYLCNEALKKKRAE